MMRNSSRLFAGVPIVLGALVLGCGGGGDDSGDGGDGEPDAAEEPAIEAAPAGVVQVLMPEDVDDLELEPLTGAMGTESAHLALTGTAEVEAIGRGEAARGPAEGERFVVAGLTSTPVPMTDVVDRVSQGEMTQRGTATFGVAVDGAAPTPVDLRAPAYTPMPIDLDEPPTPPVADPATPQQRLLVVAVPDDAEAIELVMTSPELEQRLSLLTGEAGTGNAAVLARATRHMAAPVPGQSVSFHRTEFGMSDHATETIGVAGASLQWAGSMGDTRRAPAGRAFLHVAFDVAGVNWNLATELRLPDGTVVQPLAPEGENTDMLAGVTPVVVFDVPADFTDGTLLLGKDYTWEVPTGGSMGADFDTTVEYPLAIPAPA
jgi:hypothetical protein